MRHPAASQPSGARSSRRGAFERGLVLALVLHATGLTLTALLVSPADEPPGAKLPPRDPTLAAFEFELEQQAEPGQSSTTAAAESGPPSAAAGSGAESLAALARPRAAPAPGSGAPSVPGGPAPVAARASAAASAVDDFHAAFEPEPGAPPGAQEGTGEGTGADATGAASPHAEPSEAPRLSLDALGVGAGHNPFLGPSSSPAPSVRQALGRQIDHVLRSGLAQHDRELGLGPEGPAVALVTELVMQSESAPNTSALLGLRTDGDGYTVDVEVREAAGETAAWEAVAAELKRKLAGQRLRVPTGTGGVTMQLRVTSRNTLPSGADPGLAIELFGLELKSGDGPRSSRLQILTPKISVQEVEAPYGDGRQKVQALTATLAIVGFFGDPVDIGSVARRVVHAYLVSLETHPKEQDAVPTRPH